MRHLGDLGGDGEVVVVIGRRLAILAQRSVITLVKPCWIAERQVAGRSPWSRCRQTGISGQVATAACTIAVSIRSPA
jgi:hypothetical protein